MPDENALIGDHNFVANPIHKVVPFRSDLAFVALRIVSINKLLPNGLDAKFIRHGLTIAQDFKLLREYLSRKVIGTPITPV